LCIGFYVLRTSFLALLCAAFISIPVQAYASCGPDALGTHRILSVNAGGKTAFTGHEKSFGLKRGEVILTFDDGPIAGRTTRVLEALRKECVKATFFTVGEMARAYPKLVRRIVAQGHTLAHHTDTHNRLPTYSDDKAGQLIDRGIRSVEKIAYGIAGDAPRTPFFRYPYLARSKSTDKQLRKRGLIAFGANIDSRDWEAKSAGKVHDKIMKLLKREGKGIVLMHDIQSRTAKMLPRLLRSLKAGGYKIVHMVPASKGVPAERKLQPLVVAAIHPQFSKHHFRGNSSRYETRPALKTATLVSKKISPGIAPVARKLKRISKLATKRTGVIVKVRSKIKRTRPYNMRIGKRRRSPEAKARIIAVASKGWKLRSSQWIIR